jgi:hypothetical protein
MGSRAQSGPAPKLERAWKVAVHFQFFDPRVMADFCHLDGRILDGCHHARLLIEPQQDRPERQNACTSIECRARVRGLVWNRRNVIGQNEVCIPTRPCHASQVPNLFREDGIPGGAPRGLYE